MPAYSKPEKLTAEIFAEWLSDDCQYCVFLDIDGTLSPFELNPKHSKIPPETLELLAQLQNKGVPIAIVTGRSLAEARQMLLPITLPIGATHGLEIAVLTHETPEISPVILTELALIIEQIKTECDRLGLKNFLLEEKPFSVALHYRQNPDLAETAHQVMQKVAKNFEKWQLKQGKFVWELMPKGADKGTAIGKILAVFEQKTLEKQAENKKNLPLCPIFIGDDISDEAGFLAVQSYFGYPSFTPTAKKGIGIKVSKPVDYPTHAQFYVDEISDVSKLLQVILQS